MLCLKLPMILSPVLVLLLHLSFLPLVKTEIHDPCKPLHEMIPPINFLTYFIHSEYFLWMEELLRDSWREERKFH